MGCCLAVEPALDHGVQAGDRHAGEKAQQQQVLPVVEHLDTEDRAGHDRGEDSEAANMPYPGDGGRHPDAPHDKAEEITGGADTYHEIRQAIGTGPQGQQGELHAMGDEQQRGRHQQRGDSGQGSHGIGDTGSVGKRASIRLIYCAWKS